MAKEAQADLIWEALFVREHAALGGEPRRGRGARGARARPARAGPARGPRVLRAQRPGGSHRPGARPLGRERGRHDQRPVRRPSEAAIWEQGGASDPRFHAALRIDPVLNEWGGRRRVEARGYAVADVIFGRDRDAARRFLDDWVERMRPALPRRLAPGRLPLPGDGPRGG